MTKKSALGQFFTTNSDYILQRLVEVLPQDESLICVDPFAGNQDLLKWVKRHRHLAAREAFDIDPKSEDVEQRDSLLNPPNLTGRWVVTNPPYLAKNKCKDKTIFEKYEVDDLYKASLKMLGGFGHDTKCEGGVIIVPVNFFSDRDKSLRQWFFEQYAITFVNVFEEQVFEDTSYIVCAFGFRKIVPSMVTKHDSALSRDAAGHIKQRIEFNFFRGGKKFGTNRWRTSYDNGYLVGSQFFDTINRFSKDWTPGIRRLAEDQPVPEDWFVSRLYLRAIDTGSDNGRIGLELRDEPFMAKCSDRTFATIVAEKSFSPEEESFIVEEFNRRLEEHRKSHQSMFLTNFRNSSKTYSRKRIDFMAAYKLIQAVYSQYEGLPEEQMPSPIQDEEA